MTARSDVSSCVDALFADPATAPGLLIIAAAAGSAGCCKAALLAGAPVDSCPGIGWSAGDTKACADALFAHPSQAATTLAAAVSASGCARIASRRSAVLIATQGHLSNDRGGCLPDSRLAEPIKLCGG